MYTSGTSIIKNLIASTTKGLLIASALLVGVGFSLAQENTSEASNTESSCTSCIQTPIPLDQYRQNILSIINILNTTQSAYQERSSNIAVRAWQNSRESLKIFLKNTAAVGILITKNV